MLWSYYIQLAEIEQAFKQLKHALSVRPIFHQLDKPVDAHIFVCFIANSLLAKLKQIARHKGAGLAPRSILEKFAGIQMV